jgi:hypothetical protein
MKRPTDAVGICINLKGLSRIELKLGLPRIKQSSVIDQ